jgi:threonyl-tRNA synthetase
MKKFYVDVDDSNSTLPKRVRQMQIEGYNYMLIVGE